MNHICTLKYGTRYGPTHVNRLYDAITRDCKDIVFHCLTDDAAGLNPNIRILTIDNEELYKWTHWNKMRFYDSKFVGARSGDTIMIMDIDQIFVRNASPIIDHPVLPGQFLSAYRWWSKYPDNCAITGSIQKYPADDTLVYLWNNFLKNPSGIMNGYNLLFRAGKIEEEVAPGYGEQNYIYDNVKITHEIIYYPHTQVGKLTKDPLLLSKLNRRFVDRVTHDEHNIRGGLLMHPLTKKLYKEMILINFSGQMNDVFTEISL